MCINIHIHVSCYQPTHIFSPWLHCFVCSNLSPHSRLPIYLSSVTKQTHREQHNCRLSPFRVKALSCSCFQCKKPTHTHAAESHHPQGQCCHIKMERKEQERWGQIKEWLPCLLWWEESGRDVAAPVVFSVLWPFTDLTHTHTRSPLCGYTHL